MWKDICWKETLNWEEEPVLELDLAVPLPVEEDRGAVRMGRWCARLAAVWYRRWTGSLYREAGAALEEARAAARPFWPWKAGLTWTLAWEDEKVCSLWLEGRERRGREEALVLRSAMTWTRRDGFPLALSQCLPAAENWKEAVLARVEAGLEAMRREGVSLRRDAGVRAAARLDPRRFFLGPEGPILYYPMGALGPNSSGILEFPLRGNTGSELVCGQKNPEKV